MKRDSKSILIFLLALILISVGCTNFSDVPGKSVWSEGLWMIPWITALGSLWFFYSAYKQGKEKAIQFGQTENVPAYQFGQFYFGVGLFLTTIIIIWMTINNK